MSNFKKGVFGSILLVGESFLNKAIGLVSTLILARVLLPEDFGIVAIAMLTIGFFQILANTGSVQYLLRAESIDNSEVNTAWSINILIRIVLCLAIYIASFYAADYYDDDRLKNLLLVLSLIYFCNSLQNPGIIYLKRKQEYWSIVKVGILGKTLAVGTAVFVALYFKSYWALVAGQATGALVSLIGYYLIHPFRPKFELSNARKQWAFSGWMIPQSILGYLRTQLDTILVSSVFGKAELGSYHTMKYIGFIPTSHLIIPMTEVFLVEMRKVASEAHNFYNMFNATLLLTLLIAAPSAAFLLYFHESVTLILLGENWIKYSEILGAFGLLIPASVLHRHCCRTIIIYNKPKHILFYEIGTFIFIYSILFFVGLKDLLLFTYMRVGIEQFVSLGFLLYVSLKYTDVITTLKLFFGIFLIAITSVISILFVSIIPKVSDIAILNLVVLSACFFLSFYLIFLIVFGLFLRQFSEWKYISSLILRLLSPIAKRISSSVAR
jgi:lipopolysaccharide exporter